MTRLPTDSWGHDHWQRPHHLTRTRRCQPRCPGQTFEKIHVKIHVPTEGKLTISVILYCFHKLMSYEDKTFNYTWFVVCRDDWCHGSQFAIIWSHIVNRTLYTLPTWFVDFNLLAQGKLFSFKNAKWTAKLLATIFFFHYDYSNKYIRISSVPTGFRVNQFSVSSIVR